MTAKLTISAVGDISFQGRHGDTPVMKLFEGVRSQYNQSDLVIGNLESPLIRSPNPVPNKCTLSGSIGWSEIIKEAGINILSLANNHIMDHGEEGLRDTLSCLKEAGIHTVGAGRNIDEAQAPLFMDIAGLRLAILARSSVIVSSPNYAARSRPGAAFLDVPETTRTLRDCKKEADTVILLLHWGLENYAYPSPEQRGQAREFARSGADLVIGHHPHVLQGIERFGNSLVAYSLGNFLFDEFEWESVGANGPEKKLNSGLTEENRQGLIFSVKKEKSDKTFSYEVIYTNIDDEANIITDSNPQKKVQLEHISKDFQSIFYNQKWRLYSLKTEWDLRLKKRLSPIKIMTKIRKLRPHHFGQSLRTIHRSIKIVFGKSTNPYD